MIGTLLWLRSLLQTSRPSRRGSITSRDHEIDVLLVEAAQSVLAVAGLDDAVPVAFEREREKRLDRLLVVDEQYGRGIRHRSGRLSF